MTRLVTYAHAEGWQPAFVVGDRLVDVDRAADEAGTGARTLLRRSVCELLALDTGAIADIARAAERLAPVYGTPRAAARVGLPVPDAGKILCVGLNYPQHTDETRSSGVLSELPAAPVVFSKFRSSLIAHGGIVRAPSDATELDFEAELAIVIGREASGVRRSEAMQHVAGYTCFNDFTARDLQFATSQWTMGKAFDTSGAVGPELVLADEIADPTQLVVRGTLNGEIVQEDLVASMTYSIEEIIEYISSAITLSPGDIIATGTPAGVGMARTPKLYLRPGDEFVVTIPGVGELSNRVGRPVATVAA